MHGKEISPSMPERKEPAGPLDFPTSLHALNGMLMI